MASNFENLEMGPCLVDFKGVDLGLTKGGVEVEFSTDIQPITVDQYGDSQINDVIKGRTIKVRVPMAERDLEKLAVAFPGSTLVEGTNAKKLVVNAAVGTSLRSLAGKLVLHPKDRASNDKSADVTVPLAMSKGDIQFSFKHDDQRVYTVEFSGYVNLETGELFILGDPDTVQGSSLSGLGLTGALEGGEAGTLTITGATATSTITGSVPAGLTINSSDRTITGTLAAGDYVIVLTETLAGRVNSPRTTVINITVSA